MSRNRLSECVGVMAEIRRLESFIARLCCDVDREWSIEPGLY
jgi:hypothetical protein